MESDNEQRKNEIFNDIKHVVEKLYPIEEKSYNQVMDEEEKEIEFQQGEKQENKRINDKEMYELMVKALDSVEEELINAKMYETIKNLYFEYDEVASKDKNRESVSFNKIVEESLNLCKKRKELFDRIVENISRKSEIWKRLASPDAYDYFRKQELNQSHCMSDGEIRKYIELLQETIVTWLQTIYLACWNRSTESHICNRYGTQIGVAFGNKIDSEAKQLIDYMKNEIEYMGKKGENYRGIDAFSRIINTINDKKMLAFEQFTDIEVYTEMYKDLSNILYNEPVDETIKVRASTGWKSRVENYFLVVYEILQLIRIHKRLNEIKEDHFFINQNRISKILHNNKGVSQNQWRDIIFDLFEKLQDYQKEIEIFELEKWQSYWISYTSTLKEKFDKIELNYTFEHIDVKVLNQLTDYVQDKRLGIKYQELQQKFFTNGKIEKRIVDQLKEETNRYYEQIGKNEEKSGEMLEGKGLVEKLFLRTYESTINSADIDEMTREDKRNVYNTELYCLMHLMKEILKLKAQEASV